MKKVILICLFSATAFANKAYDLKMNLNLNNDPATSYNLTVQDGVKGSIDSAIEDFGGNFIDVLATENKGDKILMKFEVGTIDESGKKIIVAMPQILAKEGASTSINFGPKSHPSSLAVTASRIQ